MSLSEINDRIAKETRRVGRADGDVALIAVSKVQPNARVDAVLAEGHRIFGENKVQEPFTGSVKARARNGADQG